MNGQMARSFQAWMFPTLALCAAALLHGAFSSPAPKVLGIAEILIMICLALATAPRLQEFLQLEKLWQQPARPAWLWLLLIPFAIALLSGNDIRDTSRDMIAVCFLGLPALAGGIAKSDTKKFALALAAAGAILAARYWLITNGFSAFRNLKSGDALLYLALDPLVLFAAVYFPILLIEVWNSNYSRFLRFLISAFCLLAAGLCWGALAGMMMRGALVLGVVALTLYALQYWRRPFVPIVMGLVALTVICMFHESLLRFLESLLEKTRAVGLNARDAEFAAIWKIQATDPIAFLFGQGWGAVYSSPAVGGYWVNYSHSALGFYFLKTGIIGVMAITFYLSGIMFPLRRTWQNHRAVIFAALPPVLLSFTLYTSYKFLGCGLLLLLLTSLHAHSDPQPR